MSFQSKYQLSKMSEKFNLKWNDFHSNVSRSFGLFRNESYLHDVTLVSDDYKHIPAHKLVLSASSEFFRNILQQTKHPQPLLCLDGVHSTVLQNVLDYVYAGEVRIYQEDLDRFLNVAQKLKLEGLNGQDAEEGDENQEEIINADRELPGKTEITQFNQSLTATYQTPKQTPLPTSNKGQGKILALNDSFNLEEHKEKLNEQVLTNEDRSVTCKICGKTSQPNQKNLSLARSNMRIHVEIHFEGLSYPCQFCDKTFRYANSLACHKSSKHKSVGS